ncbi:DUF6265 family protein [Chitinophaga lutea]|nr:DUF6265 family protein [Chitinophaga lutea]
MKYLLLCMICCTTVGPISRSAWLLGTWSGGTPGRQLVEIWEKQNDSTFTGRGLMVKGVDTALLEAISLEERNGQLYYVPTVTGQNKGQAVRFTLTSITGSQLAFENPSHDFPQKVTYTLVTPDSLLAEISGTVNGTLKSRKFPMKRVK